MLAGGPHRNTVKAARLMPIGDRRIADMRRSRYLMRPAMLVAVAPRRDAAALASHICANRGRRDLCRRSRECGAASHQRRRASPL